MGTLLSKRPLLLIAALLILASTIYFHISLGSESTILLEKEIKLHIENSINEVERELNKRYRKSSLRANRLKDLYQNRLLKYRDMRFGEALVKYEGEEIVDYAGEVYFRDLKSFQYNDDGWCLVQKGKTFFIVIKLYRGFYYSGRFFEKEEIINFFNKKYLSRNLSYTSPGLPSFNGGDLDFFWSRNSYHGKKILKNSNSQIQIKITTPEELDVREGVLEQKLIFYLHILLLGIIARYLLMGYSDNHLIWVGLVACEILMFIAFYKFAGLVNFGVIDIGGGFPWLNSVSELLVFAFFLNYLSLKFVKTFRNIWLTQLWATISAVLVVILASFITSRVEFDYSSFNFEPHYLSFLATLLLLHLVPLRTIRNLSKGMKAKGLKFPGFVFGFLILSGGFILFLTHHNPTHYFIIFLIILVGIFKRTISYRIPGLFCIALSVFIMLNQYSEEHKKSYLEETLINIFRNQGNYAKLVTREIIYEVRSEVKNFENLLDGGDHKDLLERIWGYSLAAGERVPSGIFLLDKNRKLLSSFAYKIPSYIEIGETESFSFWTIEEVSADLFGKRVPIALGSIKVNRGFEHLGYIQVVVIDSSELLYRDPDHFNIFNLDQKVKKMGISYVRLDKEGFIIENPSNINLSEIPGIIKKDGGEVAFLYLGQQYKGRVFRDRGRTFLLFYPVASDIHSIAVIIKIFFLALILYFLLNIRKIPSVKIKESFHTFSSRVFVILILTAFFVGSAFAVFSLRFINQNSVYMERQGIHNKTGTADNMLKNILDKKGVIDQNDLYWVAHIIGNDLLMYSSGKLNDSSDYTKKLEAPVLLSSDVASYFSESRNQYFFKTEEEFYNMFFQINDYVFKIDFAIDTSASFKIGMEYPDFLITVLFILSIVSFYIAKFFRNRIVSPIYKLNNMMGEVEKGNLSELNEVPKETEFSKLYKGFNEMVKGVREQKKNLSEITQMRTVVKMGRRVAHEVKNPLTPIKLSAEQILYAMRDKRVGFEDMVKKSVQYIIEETEHLKKVSRGFLDLSKIEEPELAMCDIVKTLKEEVVNFRMAYPLATLNFTEEDSELLILIDEVKMRQVFKNLILNGIESVNEDRSPVIDVNIEKTGNFCIIKISDNGVGMSPEELEVVFDEGYSTKSKGTGLGLFITRSIVQLHRGRISMNSVKHEGTVVTLEIPFD